MADPQDMMSDAGSPQGALEALRKLRAAAGIQPGSVIDTAAKGVVNAPISAVQGMGQAGSNLWHGLADAPRPPQPGGDVPIPQGGIPSLGSSGPNPGMATPPPPDNGLHGGSFKGLPYQGPQVMASALQGLQAQQPTSALDSIPTEELYKQAFAAPGSVAPGANEWAGQNLRDRIGDQEFMKDIQQESFKNVSGAQDQLNPLVSQAADADAMRKALPAMLTGQSNVEAAKVAAGSPYQNALAQMLLGQGGQGSPTDIRSISKSGVSFTPNQQVPPSLIAALQKAQNAAGGMDLFGTSAAGLKRAQQDVLNSMTLPPHIKAAMMGVLANPNAPVDPRQFSPEERQQMDYLHSFLGLQ